MAECDRQTLRLCYEVLEIKPSASLEEVKEAYRDLAFVWHPDRYVCNPRLQKKAQDRFQAINHAYHVLEVCLSHRHNHGHDSCTEHGGSVPRSPVAQAYPDPANTHPNHSHSSHTHTSHNSHHPSHQPHSSTDQATHQATHQHHSYHRSHPDCHRDHHLNHHPDSHYSGYGYNHHAADRERERRINMKPPPKVEINPWLLLCVICFSGVLTNMTVVISHGAPFLELVLPRPALHQR